MIRKYLLMAASCLTLAACSTIQERRVPPPGPIDDVRSPETMLYGKSSATAEPAGDRPATASRQRPADGNTIARAFLDSYDAAYRASAYGNRATVIDIAARDATALEMTKLGMTVIEVRCDAFFASIGRGSQRLGFFRRQIEILSTALTTALGLSSASDTLVAAAGIGSGAALSTLANYESTFFFSPDVGKVQHLVDDALEKMRVALLERDKAPRDFEGAIRALKRYQSVCTAHEIKRLVNEAVESGSVRAVINGPLVNPLDVAVDTIVVGIGKKLRAPVQLRDMALMKWIVEDTPTPDQLDFICPSFTSGDLRGVVCDGDLGNRKINPAFGDQGEPVKKAIDAVDQLRPELLADTLETWKAAESTARDSIGAARKAAASNADETAKSKARVDALEAALDAAQRVDVASPANPDSQRQPSLSVIRGE